MKLRRLVVRGKRLMTEAQTAVDMQDFTGDKWCGIKKENCVSYIYRSCRPCVPMDAWFPVSYGSHVHAWGN
ncbi:hypothetical protein PTKU15_84730 [Paraburkholderia terrae]|nr:hypothetical protein PTKU15_84730 [Paraburkholderia terrae]